LSLTTVRSTSFGQALRALRKELNISQSALADRLSSTQRHLSFLETGRAQPSTQMVDRISRVLGLPISKRLSLYEAAGLTSPYKRRDFGSEEVLEALDIVEKRVLAHWPFPAYVLNKRWDILRMNDQGNAFLGQAASPGSNEAPNLFELLMENAFRDRVLNWTEVAPILATRLIREAREDAGLAALLQRASEQGLFTETEAEPTETVPIFVPVLFEGPGGIPVRMTSLLGQLVSVQDAIIEGLTIELLVPIDQESEDLMR